VSGRTDLAIWLESVLPDTWTVIDHDANPVLSKPTVMTYVDRVEAGVTRSFRLYRVTVIVMLPKQAGADSELEDAMEEVLEAVDLWDYPCTWSAAEYSVFAETYPAYKISTEMNVKRLYDEDQPVPDPDPALQED
jgi:hypothetical protein